MHKFETPISRIWEENPVHRPHPQSHQSVLTIGGPIILLLLDRIALALAAAAAYLSPAERKEGGREESGSVSHPSSSVIFTWRLSRR